MKFDHILLVMTVLALSVSNRGLAEELCDKHISPDNSFSPQIEEPAFPDAGGNAPLVVIDEAHHNLHTIDGRFKPFAELLKKDGYTVESSVGKYDTVAKAALKKIDILVVVNALNSVNLGKENCTDRWKLPIPSAFEENEIGSLVEWVKGGGSLLLLADHYPFPSAVEELAAEFGVLMNNGYTYPVDVTKPIEFKTIDGSLKSHPITRGRAGSGEQVDSVFTFTGQAFRAKPSAKVHPLMVLGEGVRTYMPSNLDAGSTDFMQNLMASPYILSEGMMQGAVLEFGKGRVVILGEAGLFSAQKFGEMMMGMNYPPAKYNAQFALNVMHWLSGLL